MLRDDVRELRREVAEARQAAQDAWPVLPDSQSSGSAETFRRIIGLVNEASGVASGAPTFNADNIRPICGGVNPAASTADGVNITINDAKGSYSDNAEIYAEWDNDNSEWIDVTDQGSEQFRRVIATVNEMSGVTQGAATFTVDNVRPISSGINPVASTGDGVNLTVNDAVASYSDNDTIYAEWDNDNSEWIDVTDKDSAAEPQTYNVKLQEAKALTDTDVSVKFLEDDLTTENGAAFDAYDPHQKFSSGKVTDAVGRVTRVTDPDTGNNRFEFTHLTSLARYVTATLAENEGATTSGKASASSYAAEGNGWHVTSPTGTINIIGLDGQQAGDQVRAVLVDPDSTPQEYLAVQVPDKNDDEKVKVNTNESAAGFLEDQLVNTGTLTGGYQRVYFRVAGDDDTMYAETEEASGGTEAERIIVGQLKAPSGVAIGTATFVIDNVRPLASGTDPVGGNAATEVTINDAIGGYVDNQEIRAVWDDAENTGSGGWKDATIHRFTRIRGLVNEGSGVADGASGWAVDNIELLSGSADPGATVDGYVAKQAYANNDPVELIWNDEDVRWEDCTDVEAAGDTIDGARPNSADLAHGANAACDIMEFTGGSWSDTTNDGTLYNLTGHTILQSQTVPAVLITGTTYVAVDNHCATVVTATASGDSNAGSSYAAITAGSITGWDGEDSGLSIGSSDLSNPLELEVDSGDKVVAVGDYNGTAGKWVIVNVEKKHTPLGVIEPVSIILDVPARSGAVAGSAASSGDIYAMCNADNVGQSGIVINGRTYDFTSASLGELIEPNTPVTVRLFNHSLNAVEAPASGLLFCDAKKIGDGGAQEEYQIVSPPELRTLTGFDGDGTADQVITHVDGDIEWEDTGACS